MELSWNKNKSDISEEWDWESKDPKNRASFMLPLNEDMQKIRESVEHGRDLTKFSQNDIEQASKNLGEHNINAVGPAKNVLYYIQDALRGPYPRVGENGGNSPTQLNALIRRIGWDLDSLKVLKKNTLGRNARSKADIAATEKALAESAAKEAALTPLQKDMRAAASKRRYEMQQRRQTAARDKALSEAAAREAALTPREREIRDATEAASKKRAQAIEASTPRGIANAARIQSQQISRESAAAREAAEAAEREAAAREAAEAAEREAAAREAAAEAALTPREMEIRYTTESAYKKKAAREIANSSRAIASAARRARIQTLLEPSNTKMGGKYKKKRSVRVNKKHKKITHKGKTKKRRTHRK